MTEETQTPVAEAKKDTSAKPAESKEGGQRRRRPSNRNRNRQKPKEGEAKKEGEGQNRNRNNRSGGNRGDNRGKSGGRSGGNRNRRRNAPAPTEQSLLENARKNEAAQKERISPYLKIDNEVKAKVRITPLGGLGEIGGNMMVMETDNEAILIDVGMSFPDEEMHGVDILVPDFTYVREIKNKIVAVIITHAHEDHIGAVPYLFKEMQFPIYGTALPLAMIGNKFDEHHLKEFRRYFRPIEKRTVYDIGNDFKIEWMHMTHSIIDASSVAVTTEAGTVIHTGDFKIDHTP
ncbi:MAG TPA: ribonuclease J, partial [Sulfuricurvum sp.]|nr:ribonuclease J [Sulfuricurvum sp.]